MKAEQHKQFLGKLTQKHGEQIQTDTTVEHKTQPDMKHSDQIASLKIEDAF